MPNNRNFFAVDAVGIAADGSTSYTVVHGLQSLGTTTTFNLERILEIGQIETYETIENTPDVEATLERVLDGYPLAYHLATQGAGADNSLVARAPKKCALAMSVFLDTQNSASGTPLAEVNMSGMFVSNLNYVLPVEGNCTETVTLIGSHKQWKTASFTFSGSLFDNNDQPLALSSGLGGIQRRENVIFGTSTYLPQGQGGIPGISASGTNDKTNDVYGAHVQQITISTDLNRTSLLELGRKNPFARQAGFPVDVTCDIEVLTGQGDSTDATEAGVLGSGQNTENKRIIVVLEDSTTFNLGTRNRLNSVTRGGGGVDGTNETFVYSFGNSSTLSISQDQDPS